MLHTILIKCKMDVIYFIFIFILPSLLRFSVKNSVNQLIKNKASVKHFYLARLFPFQNPSTATVIYLPVEVYTG